MYNPVSTYRLQFNKDFTIQDAASVVNYLVAMGIRTVYASPIFAAIPGSNHGYDVINPFVINPEIGTEAELRQLITTLKERGIGWVQDIVPNHMAYHTANPWVEDVLEKGQLSPYAEVFDTTWSGDFHVGRPMVPFLEDSLKEVIRKGKLKVCYHQTRFCLQYGDLYFPLNSRSYGELLQPLLSSVALDKFVAQLEDLHQVVDPVQYALRWHELLLQLSSLMRDPSVGAEIESRFDEVNDAEESLLEIADKQFYSLCSWRETDHRINYRRFFLVNGLICLNISSERVFNRVHQRIASFVQEGLFQGVRVDHIDGLLDPVGYLHRLRALCGSSCYIVVEKILEHGEKLDTSWPIQGTTGYEFLSTVNNLFTRSSAENRFSSFYRSLTGDKQSITEKISEKKQYILDHHMQGELASLTRYFMVHIVPEFSFAGHLTAAPHAEALQESTIREVIATLLVELPVYRYYSNKLPLEGDEQSAVTVWIERCMARRKDLAAVLRYIEYHLKHSDSGEWLTFYQRLMQYTGPLMAKGVEDTLMYAFNRFVGHNEVGDSPEFFGLSVDDFHSFMIGRQQDWPLSLNATSTHDTKRGEDVRTRLNVLPDLAEAWIRHVREWMEINREFKSEGSPDDNDEYFIYQNLIGVYSFTDADDLADRMKSFMTKAMREAKRHSHWTNPNAAYEEGVLKFVDSILASPAFMNSFLPFCRIVADFGMLNSLSQIALKTTCPGVPDVYQGTADWDLSLVDPDNRRPVNFHKQSQYLEDESAFKEKWQHRDNGAVKSWLLQAMLQLRSAHQKLFHEGQYIPLNIEGRRAEHCMAFARQLGNQWLIVAIPLNISRFIASADEWATGWHDTKVILPAHAPLSGSDLLSGEAIAHAGSLQVADLLSECPIAVLLFDDVPADRRAGVVLPVSSLPGPFGIGDIGASARRFVDFLHAGRQRIWQMLPINPVHQSAAFSPYSPYASMAGSTLYISPEDLIADGLLNDVPAKRSLKARLTDYPLAAKLKSKILRDAYENFRTGSFTEMESAYNAFVQAESHWLHDFALFEILKVRYKDTPWIAWPVPLRDRSSDALAKVTEENFDELDFIKWSQYIFHRQWQRLRKYCHERNVLIMGDLPFYLDRNAADVWAHRELFSVNAEGKLTAVAGVPPDYFSAEGQLWGMPVYNWKAMRDSQYDWFVQRIRRNLACFDILRLDHFRAYAAYWEVDASASTARNGEWKNGPGKELFEILRYTLGNNLNLVAEDLGEITPDVYALRDAFDMPGMYVLQFAFGENVGANLHSPHNHQLNGFVYTGTHDNNTSRGWFRKELDGPSRIRLSRYANKRITATNVAHTMIQLAYGSVARTVMIPLQDILSLNERNRINTPSTVNPINWKWRLEELPDEDEAEWLASLTRLFGR